MPAERLNQECFVSVLLSVLSVYLQEKAISSTALLLEGRYESCHLEKYIRHFSHRHDRCGQMVLSQMSDLDLFSFLRKRNLVSTYPNLITAISQSNHIPKGCALRTLQVPPQLSLTFDSFHVSQYGDSGGRPEPGKDCREKVMTGTTLEVGISAVRRN
jgi:hypothetical protein